MGILAVAGLSAEMAAQGSGRKRHDLPNWKGDKILVPQAKAFSPEVSFNGLLAPQSTPDVQLLRLSVTNLCNFRCLYCMPMTGVPKSAHEDFLPFEELAKLVKQLSDWSGIRRVQLTGGEPLVRPGIEHLIAKLSTIPAIEEVSLTTNAALLARMAWSLKAAGLIRVNISLDSLDEERFARLTRGGKLRRTLAGIDAAREAGLTPITLNTVLQRSTWQQEMPDLLNYAASNGLEVRLIELMRMGTERAWCESEFVSVDEVCRDLGFEVVSMNCHSRACTQSTLVNRRGSSVRVAWTIPRSHPSCLRRKRLRMDAHGRISRCLMDPLKLDLCSLLNRMDSEAAQKEFDSYIAGEVPPPTVDSSFTLGRLGEKK